MTGPLNPKVPLATTRSSGLMPKLSGKATDSLGGDGQWRPGSGGGITLPILESDVTGLTADLAAKALKATTLTGTSPILIDGDNAAHDLSANRTLSLSSSALSYASLLQLDYFDYYDLLPANVIRQHLYDYPTPDYEYINTGSFTVTRSVGKFVGSGNQNNVVGWDSGASYSRFLIIANLRSRPNGTGIWLSASDPGTHTVVPEGYTMFLDVNNTKIKVQKTVGGVETILQETQRVYTADDPGSQTFQVAFYVDGDTNALIVFLRVGQEMWWQPMADLSNAVFTSFRHYGFDISTNTSGQTIYLPAPFAVFAD